MIIGLAGKAGAGKDTVADLLVKHHDFQKIAFSDPMKRFCKEVFGWSDEQLWGPSELRNLPDNSRRMTNGQGLTPRRALQLLGTEFGRACYEDVWVDYAIRRARDIGGPVVITDVRFQNELDALHKVGGKVWYISREGAGLMGDAALHASENGLVQADCDRVILNEGSLSDLEDTIRLMTLKEEAA